jgi:hypothetical protein
MDGISLGVVDSDCEEIHYNGNDNQCFMEINSPGPLLFQNNFIQAAGENIMFGGGDPVISGQIASDITIVGNVFQKNPSWEGQAAPLNWVVKNLFEIKNAQRVLLDGNTFMNTWVAGQNEAIIIRSVNQSGACTWCSALDVTVTNNYIQYAPEAFVLAPIVAPSNPSVPTGRLLFQNNLMVDIACALPSGGKGLLFELGVNSTPYTMHDIIIDHNTGFSDPTACGQSGAIYFDNGGGTSFMTGLQFTNNIFNHGLDAVNGDSCGSTVPGSCALNLYASGYTYSANVLMTATGAPDGSTWPTGTLWNTLAGVSFTSTSGTNPNLTGNFQLTTGSPYHNAGTDGKDIGVWDWPVFNAKITNALNGIFAN